jgi:hypothetical protein
MTYARCFPHVSQVEASQAPGAAALMFANWSETEAAQRIRKLLAAGWSAEQIGRMFGIRVQEIDRLTRDHVIPEKDCANVG